MRVLFSCGISRAMTRFSWPRNRGFKINVSTTVFVVKPINRAAKVGVKTSFLFLALFVCFLVLSYLFSWVLYHFLKQALKIVKVHNQVFFYR